MDIRLCCVEAGEGFPLVLLHGNGEDHTYFKRQMGPFSQHFRVIAVDTRGHGESPRGTAPFTLEQFAEDLKNQTGLTFTGGKNAEENTAVAQNYVDHKDDYAKWPEYVNQYIVN